MRVQIWGTQWELNSLTLVCQSTLQTIAPDEVPDNIFQGMDCRMRIVYLLMDSIKGSVQKVTGLNKRYLKKNGEYNSQYSVMPDK